jgi:uncharacterized protein DUF4054
MAWPPTVAQFQARFTRDFNYNGSGTDVVTNNDVQNALNDGEALFNQSLWSSTTEQLTAYLFLAAHLLVLNIQVAGGLSARNLNEGVMSTGDGVIQSKGVGAINVSYRLPTRLADSAILSEFMRTNYGRRYLQMLVPRLVGNVQVVGGYVEPDVVNTGDASQT